MQIKNPCTYAAQIASPEPITPEDSDLSVYLEVNAVYNSKEQVVLPR